MSSIHRTSARRSGRMSGGSSPWAASLRWWWSLLVAVALACGSLLATVPAAHAAPVDAQLFWVADAGSGNQVWAATSATVSTAAALPEGTPITDTRRSVASDVAHLYFCDGTDLVRTALDGTGKAVVVAGVTSAEQIAVVGGSLYYSSWSDGVYVVAASATNGTPSLILDGTALGWGWDGVAVSGSVLYAENYQLGLYTATLNGTAPVTSVSINGTLASPTYVTKLLVAGGTLYAGGSMGAILATTDPSASRTLWSTLDVSSVTSGMVYSLAIVGSTLFYTAGQVLGTIQTDGTGNTQLSVDGQFVDAWSVAAMAMPTYSLMYADTGRTGGTAPVDASSPYASGSTVTVLTAGTLVKTGYQLGRWWTTPTWESGITHSYTPGSTFSITGDTTLYPRWVGGPLEFRSDPTGSAITTYAFPGSINGQTRTATIYVRNVGDVAVSVSNVTGNSGGVSRTGGTCNTGGGYIQPYNGGAQADCTFTFSWTASSGIPVVSYPFSVNYELSDTVTLTGEVLSASRIPTFSTPVRTADGFTVNVTDYDAAWSWTPVVGAGTVTPGTPSGTSLPLTVTGLTAAQTTSVTVNTARAGYDDGSANVSGTALDAARVATFDTPVATTDGFTVNVTNYDASWDWAPSVGSGTVTPGTSVGTSLPLTVTGLGVGASATVTVGTSRAGYVDGTADVTGTAIAVPAPTVPTAPSWVHVSVTSGAATVTVYPGTPNGVIVTSYTVTLAGTSLRCTVPAGGTNCRITGLPYRSSYAFSVVANGGSGHSAATTGTARMLASTVRTPVYYGARSAILTSTMKLRLNAFVAGLPRGASVVTVDVVGYVQASSSRANDARLSLARARTVEVYLTAHGVHVRIAVHGKGILGVTKWSRAATVALTYAVQKVTPLPI